MEIGFLDFMNYNEWLSNNEAIRSYVYLPGIKSSKKQIESFESSLGVKLSDFLKQYVSQPMPLSKLEWSDDHLQRGSAYFPSLKGMLTGSPFTETRKKAGERHKDLLWNGSEEEALIRDLEHSYFIFDIVSMPGSVFTLIRFGDAEASLFLLTYPSFIFPLKLSVEQYMEEASRQAATHLWQEQFIDLDVCSDKLLAEIKSWRTIPEPSNALAISSKKIYDFVRVGVESAWRMKLELRVTDLTAKIKKMGGHMRCGHPFSTNQDKTLNLLVIRKVERSLGFSLPEEFLSFYSQINGLELEWIYEGLKIGGRFAGARTRLLSFEEVFGGFDYAKRRVWDDQTHEGLVTMRGVMDDDALALAQQCRPILVEDGVSVVVRFMQDQASMQVLILISGKFYPIDTSFTDFMETFLKVGGLRHFMVLNRWNQQMEPADLANYNPVRRQIQHLFEEVDLTDYHEVKSNLE